MKQAAIKEHHLYNKAYQHGSRAGTRCVTVYVLRDYAAKRLMLADPLHRSVNRVGLSVSKKVGKACARTRAKRILREAYRSVAAQGTLRTGFLIVISAHPEIVGKKTQELTRELRYAFHKTGLLPNSAPRRETEPAPQQP